MPASRRRRRRRSSVKPSHLITAAASLVAVASLTHAHLLVWVLLTALAATVAYTLGRLHGQKPARKQPTEFAKRKRAVQRAARVTSTNARGCLPPDNPDLRPMMISAECSDGTCGLCPRNGCEHDCMHDPAIIVARNAAEYDRTHQQGRTP